MSLIQSAKLNGHGPYASQGRAGAIADAAGESRRGAVAASLDHGALTLKVETSDLLNEMTMFVWPTPPSAETCI
ncbi:hypothetical protein J2W39_000187 [Variovorax paradoxus]|uniref:Uncharacterized protein n=1 Tax=Variovorax paradoxus TaxID=34073 RepID=A0AAW8E8Y9_VARPD|nr:hypothetical protein [Variovorax paradoxus]